MDDDLERGLVDGGITTGVGVCFPLVFMAWNTLVQLSCGVVTGFISCLGGCYPCSCGAITGCGAEALCPVWWCSQPLCACGSCSALGKVWLQIITFAGFTALGTIAWYIFVADFVFTAGLFILLVTGVRYAVSKINEPSESTAVVSPLGPRTNGFKEMKLTVCESIETGQMKF